MKVYTQKAGKNYPAAGIKKGDTYYRWAFFRQKDQISKTYPTRSQLTQNEASLMIYSAYDGDAPKESGDIESAAETLREAAQVERDKLENMPEGLQQGDTGQALEERADAFESAADELDTLASELGDEEGYEVPEKPTKNEGESDEDFEARVTEAAETIATDDGDYFSFDAETWTRVLDQEALNEAFSTTEPST